MGVFPPETIFASVGLFMTSLTFFISLSVSGASTKMISAPASSNATALLRASSMPRPVLLSVRAMIKKSSFVLVSTATLIFLTMSQVGITRLPGVCPHFFGYS